MWHGRHAREQACEGSPERYQPKRAYNIEQDRDDEDGDDAVDLREPLAQREERADLFDDEEYRGVTVKVSATRKGRMMAPSET